MFSKKSKGATTFDDKNSGISGLLWMLLGAIIVIITGLIAYKSGKFTFLQNNKKEEIKVVDAPTIQLKKDSKEENYEFYDILPEQEMSTISDDALISEIAQSDPTPAINLDEFKPDVIVTTDKDAENQKKAVAEAENKETKSDKAEIATAKTVEEKTKSTETSTTKQETTSKKEEPKQATTKQGKIVKGDKEITITYENATYDENDKKTEKKATPSKPPAEKKQPISKVEKIDIKPIKEAPASNTKSYILQINSYDEASQADKRRAQVLMAGVDAKVIKKNNGDNVVYQVVSTAMNKPSDVLKSQRLLQKNGIDSLIIEQRHK